VAEHAPVGTVGQTRGAIRRFGFVATAGTLAAELGIVSWRPCEATWAAVTWMKAWLAWRGA
jgi:hypothetical protein